MTRSSLGDILPKATEANCGYFMTGISISIYYMAVVEWHREAGSKELHNPCALYREITALAGYIDVLGKASHKASCCCLLTIARDQTLKHCSSTVAEALRPLHLHVKYTTWLRGRHTVLPSLCRIPAEQLFPALIRVATLVSVVDNKVHAHFFEQSPPVF